MLRKLVVLMALAFVLAIFTVGCSDSDKTVNPLPVVVDDNSEIHDPPTDSSLDGSRNPEPQALATGYPNYSFCLNVPWMKQMPPKNSSDSDDRAWKLTNNCGQAVCVMLGGYFNNGVVAPWVIDEENRWLHYPLPYGYGTSASTLVSLLWNFHAVHAIEYHSVGANVLDVINEVVNNRRPTIVCVTIKKGVLVPRGTVDSRTHWVLAVGWDGEVVLHDPGTSSGRFIHYTIAEFRASWAFNYCYIPTWK